MNDMRGMGKMMIAALALGGIASAFAGSEVAGRVTCGSEGLPGVMVTDGYSCVVTDGEGRYSMELDGDARFVYVSTPSGYLPVEEKTVPQFYIPVENGRTEYNFELAKNPVDDTHHVALVQADVQLTSMQDLDTYEGLLKDVTDFAAGYRGKADVFGIDLGDMVGDTPSLFEPYLDVADAMSTFNTIFPSTLYIEKATCCEGRQYIVAACSIMYISSSLSTPAMFPLSFTPMSNRPPLLFAKADMLRAIFRASEIWNLKS